MRRPRFQCVLWLIIAACSTKPEQIVLPALEPRGFDNPEFVDGGVGGVGQGSFADASLSGDSCANGQIDVPRVAPKVVLVLDGSCSMSTDYPANGEESATQCTRNARGRWAALRNALVGPQGVVPALENLVAFGLVVYGTSRSCPIPGRPVPPELGTFTRIRSALPEIQPGMYTPTGPALDWVYENMITEQTSDSRGAAQIVILATDGEPNSCGGGLGGLGFGSRNEAETNYGPSLDAVRRGAMRGATTYVISLADATGPFHEHLRELASLGNPAAKDDAKLYEPASPEQLADTLKTLARAAVSCDLELNGSILLDQACDGTVSIDGTALDCNDPNGWMPLDERNIRLQGDACKRLMTDDAARIETSFTCTGFRPD